MSTLDLGVLVSGGGTNLQAILDAVSQGRLDARVRLVVSNRPEAKALLRAAAASVPSVTLSHGDYPSREAFDLALVQALRDAGVRTVVLAGFMRLLTPTFLDAFPYGVLNIHPALLPSFPGVHGQRQALQYGVKISGCTVHFVDHGTDTGPVIAQAAVPVLDEDTEESLCARILLEEHRLLVEVLRWMSEERVVVETPGAGMRTRVRIVGVAGSNLPVTPA